MANPFPWHYVVPPVSALFNLATDLLLATRPDPYYRFCPPRWAYRAVLLTFPVSWPLLLLLAVVLLPFMLAEFLLFGVIALAVDLWDGGN